MISKTLNLLIVAIVFTVFLPNFTFAQYNASLPYSVSNEVDIAVVPTYPKPGDIVSITLSLYTEDLNTANISWYKDGKLEKSGKGEMRFSFTANKAGQETKISVNISLANGPTFTKNFTINPTVVDLIWEANTYTPPFYKGKALHSKQGVLKIVAIPEFIKNGNIIPAQNLVYEWTQGESVIQNQSGYGKNTLVVNGSILGKSEEIGVTVTDPINNLVGVSYLNISPSNPEIVFYENNPYYGHIFDRALVGSHTLSGEEMQVVAAPYFFSKEASGKISYNWRLNGKLVNELSQSRTAIFRKPEGKSGQSNILLGVENANRILQQANGGLTIKFSN